MQSLWSEPPYRPSYLRKANGPSPQEVNTLRNKYTIKTGLGSVVLGVTGSTACLRSSTAKGMAHTLYELYLVGQSMVPFKMVRTAGLKQVSLCLLSIGILSTSWKARGWSEDRDGGEGEASQGDVGEIAHPDIPASVCPSHWSRLVGSSS